MFFEDAKEAIRKALYEESVYADDLNAYRVFPSTTANIKIVDSLKLCQTELHAWGDANSVAFDAGKYASTVRFGRLG